MSDVQDPTGALSDGGALPPPRTYATTEMTAEVYDHGAQVTRWAPAGVDPVLWLSPRARFAAGTAIRGGVPICFPWFGPGRSADLRPAHGFARTTPWRLVSENAGDAAVSLHYELTDADATAPAFPFRYHAAYRIVLGPELALDLTVTNTGDEPFEVDEALHAYLAVGDVRQVRLEGLEGVAYVDKVGGGMPVQDGPVRFSGETDRVYHCGGPVRLVDPVLGRTLVVGTRDAHNIVVWTPWAEKAGDASDIGEESWTSFVCVEAANALEDFVTVAPGASHTLGYRLRLETPGPG